MTCAGRQKRRVDNIGNEGTNWTIIQKSIHSYIQRIIFVIDHLYYMQTFSPKKLPIYIQIYMHQETKTCYHNHFRHIQRYLLPIRGKFSRALKDM